MKIKNAIIAFISGGVVGVISEILFYFFNTILKYGTTESYTFVTLIFIITASILTGLHIFDKIVTTFKAGVIIPITGFAHSMTSAAIDNKKEGLVNGIGSNIFKLTGSVILYGILGAFVVALIKGVLL